MSWQITLSVFPLWCEAALLRTMALPVPVLSVRCFASFSCRFFLCCFYPRFFVGSSSNFDITSLMVFWSLSRSSFLSNSLLPTSSDELSSSSSDSGAGDFAVGTRCAYVVKGVSSSLSVVCQGDAFACSYTNKSSLNQDNQLIKLLSFKNAIELDNQQNNLTL